MKIYFALGFDGLHPIQFDTNMGEKRVGPLGLLAILETQLAIASPDLSHTIRTIDYLACLRQLDSSHAFYHRSLAVDEFNVATELLSWRDTWYEAGWDGTFPSGVSVRLDMMAAVEVVAQKRVGASLGQRLQKILYLLGSQQTQIDQIVLLDPIERFSMLWQRLLDKFDCVAPAALGPQANEDCDLGKLQRALQRLAQGKSSKSDNGQVIKTALAADRSFTVLRANSSMVSAQLLARWLKQLSDNKQHKTTVLLSGSDGTELDDALEEADLPRIGFESLSPWRPLLQVLPLVLELLWEPLDPAVLLQFLMHPMGPLPRRIRQPLADIVANRPGIGGLEWQQQLQSLLAQNENKHLKDETNEWFDSPRYSRQEGLPIDVVWGRTLKILDWLEQKLTIETDDAKYYLIGAAHHQASELVLILDNFQADGREKLEQEQLRYLLEKLAGRGTGIVDKVAECITNETNWILGSNNPANCYQAYPTLIWWDFKETTGVKRYPWSARELQALDVAGVKLANLQQELVWQADNWLRPILAVSEQLILVLHDNDESVHPLWDQINSCVKDWASIDAENGILDGRPSPWSDVISKTIDIVGCPLPEPRRWWQLESGEALGKRDKESYSSLDRFIHSPYQWVFAYKAQLYPGTLRQLNDGNSLKGTLVHHLYEQFFNENPDSLTNSDIDKTALDDWFDARLKKLLVEEAAVLLQPGRLVEKAQYEETARHSLYQLIRQLRAAKIIQVEMETQEEGRFVGGVLAGFIDMRVINERGQEALIDIKWGGKKYRRQSLEENSHLQLVLYANLRQQQAQQHAWPAVAYYVIDGATLLAQDTHFFPNATMVKPKLDDELAHVWQKIVATWKWRRKQLDHGLIEVTVTGTQADAASQPGEGALVIPDTSDTFNDYAVLTGWSDET
ncbi:MAG: RecB family exonuclease [Thiohalomonadales bacterium]